MRKNILFVLLLLVIAIVLIVVSKSINPDNELIKKWANASVECLPQGHQNLAQHIHSTLNITVAGEKEEILENIGVLKNCMAELHTHDRSGMIHIESVSATRTFSLSQFFDVWGKNIPRDGYKIVIMADGIQFFEPEKLILKDKQKIDISYIK